VAGREESEKLSERSFVDTLMAGKTMGNATRLIPKEGNRNVTKGKSRRQKGQRAK